MKKDDDSPFEGPIVLPITDALDLHAFEPKEIASVVEEYLEECRRMGFSEVRVIHGKGIGVQREMVRSILARTPFVFDWTDAPPQAGGLGATIVRMKN